MLIMFQKRKRWFNKMPELTYSQTYLCCSSLFNSKRYTLFRNRCGFTIIEIIIVVVILAIAAMAAIPMMSSASSVQIRSAANLIAADIEYTKSMAISRGQKYSVIFDVSTDSYRIEDQSNTVIQHPVKKGFDYIVNFQNDSRLDKVEITNVTLTDDKVGFDCLGSPDNNGGTITLNADDNIVTITVEPVTGYISINF